VVGGHAHTAGVRSGDWFTRVTITGEGRDQVAAGVRSGDWFTRVTINSEGRDQVAASVNQSIGGVSYC